MKLRFVRMLGACRRKFYSPPPPTCGALAATGPTIRSKSACGPALPWIGTCWATSSFSRAMFRNSATAFGLTYVVVVNRQNLCPCETKGHTQAGGCPRDRRELEIGQGTPILVRRDGHRFVFVEGRATSDVIPTGATKSSTEKSSRSVHIATGVKPATLANWLVGRERDGFRD